MSSQLAGRLAIRAWLWMLLEVCCAGGVDEAGARVARPLAECYRTLDGPCVKPGSGAGAELMREARLRLWALPDGPHHDPVAERLLMQVAEACPFDPVALDEVGEGLRRLGLNREALVLFIGASRRGLWRHPLQRVLSNYVPELKSAALLGEGAMRELPELRQVLTVVQDRLCSINNEIFRVFRRSKTKRGSTAMLAVPCQARRCWGKSTFPDVYRVSQGAWLHYFISRHGEKHCEPPSCNCQVYPRTCKLLKDLCDMGRRTQAMITEVTGPRSFISKHRSASQDRIRLVCPLAQPNGSVSELRFPGFGQVQYKSGHCFWFDESYEHEMLHTGPTRQAIIFDFHHPGADGRTLQGSWLRSRFGSAAVNEQNSSLPVSTMAARIAAQHNGARRLQDLR